MMLATFTAQISSIADKETSDAAREIIDNFEFPFIVADAAGQPIIARRVGNGLREKILANTLTSEEKEKLRKIIRKMRNEGIRGVNSYMDKMNASNKVYFKTRRDAVVFFNPKLTPSEA